MHHPAPRPSTEEHADPVRYEGGRENSRASERACARLVAVKVFISHSSADKWLARRIARDLEELGTQTFLDEKDIKTGESIDDSIQLHLKESDEVLIASVARRAI